MESVKNTKKEAIYWSNRYEIQSTGWDIGAPSLPLKTYIDQLNDKDLRILIPGAGNAYEAEYLFRQGFKNVFVMDISAQPLQNFKARLPDFPENQLIEGNFFEHNGIYDLILEQTFFCSFEPTLENRRIYGEKMAQLLAKKGKLVGLLFDCSFAGGPPFSGSSEEYKKYFEPSFHLKIFEKCYNSIPPRAGNELFVCLEIK